MKQLILSALILSLAGCANIGLNPKTSMPWPAAPENLKTACPDLVLVDPDTEKISDVLIVVTSNYSEYYLCKDKVNNWIEWYNSQQKIYNSVR